MTQREESFCMSCGTASTDLKEIPWTTRDKNGKWGIKCKPCREEEIQNQIKDFQKSEQDTEYTDDVICPFCGHKHEADGERSLFYEDGDHDFDCYNCGNEFEVNTSVSVSYTTTKKL